MTTGIKNIKRHDYAKCKGWWYRIMHKGKLHTKLFSDSVYQGSENSKKAAIAYKMQYEKQHKISKVPHHTIEKRSETAVVGVCFGCKYKKGILSSVGWIANIMQDNKQKHYYYSIRKWGYASGYMLARNDRIKYTQNLENIPMNPPPPPKWLIPFLNEHHINFEESINDG